VRQLQRGVVNLVAKKIGSKPQESHDSAEPQCPFCQVLFFECGALIVLNHLLTSNIGGFNLQAMLPFPVCFSQGFEAFS